MKVFVTGGTGLVGSYVINELLAKSHVPVVLVRDKTKARGLELTCELVEGDILDILSLKEGMKNCQMVIHCAGMVSFDPRKADLIYRTNVEGTANVANVCLQLGIQKMVHLSSIAAFGRQANRLKMSETTEWVDSSLNSTYARSKYLAELEVFRAGEEGLPFSIVNPSVILGPGDLTRSSTKLFDHVRKQPYFLPNGHMNVVDVRDVARSVVQLLEMEHNGRLILNWGAISYDDFYRMVREMLKISGPLIRVPKPVLACIVFFSKLKSIFVKGEPIMTSENLRFLNKKFEYDSLYFRGLFPGISLLSPKESISWAITQMFGQK